MRTITKIIRGTAIAAFLAASNFIASAIPIVYTADTPSFTLLASGNQTSQSQINTAIAPFIVGTTQLYKNNQGGLEEGSLLGSYDAAYQNPALADNDFKIAWTGGEFVNGDKKYLLVKGGSADPKAWYLYDISAWDGTEALFGVGFFPNNVPDGLSNLAIYSNRTGTSVPDGGASLALLGLVVTGFGFIRRKFAAC